MQEEKYCIVNTKESVSSVEKHKKMLKILEESTGSTKKENEWIKHQIRDIINRFQLLFLFSLITILALLISKTVASIIVHIITF